MLSVLLTILKVVGIILLAVIGVVLLTLVLILFVPVRYSAKASYDERPLGSARVSWLLHLITFRIDYEQDLEYSIRVLGINILRNRPKEGSGDEDKAEEEVPVLREEESPPKDEDLKEYWEEVPQETQKEARYEAREEAQEEYEEQVAFEETAATEERLERPVTEIDTEESAERSSDAAILREWDKVEEKGEELREESPLRAIRPAMQRFFRNIRDFFAHIGNVIEERVHYLRVELWEAAMEKRDWLVWLLTEPANVATRHLLWRQLKKLLNHIKPKKLEGDVKFGSEDPYLTGQILVAISPFYGLYGQNITVTPVFGENIIEGRVMLKGRVRVFTVLTVVIRMMMDKNFRYLLNRFLNS